VSGAELARLLDRHGFDFFTGVPCSLVEGLIAALEQRADPPWLPAVREDVALGLAAGAYLGGRRPVVIMQNSGLGTGGNALASLSLMYGLPTLLIVTWRGFEGRDAPEHLLTGQITPNLLDLMGIPFRILSQESAADSVADSIADSIAWAKQEMDARESPVALLVPPGVVVGAAGTVPETSGTGGAGGHARASGEVGPPRPARSSKSCDSGERVTEPIAGACPPATGPVPLVSGTVPAAPTAATRKDTREDEALQPVISRREAIAIAVKELGDEAVVHANGFVCRESHAIDDRPQNFYMLGSMGLASAIALGLALVRPERASVVFDGDGNLLMSLGTLAMVGSLTPPNFIHLVFDNEVYGSTGGQRSASREVRLDRLALSAGYRTATAVTAPDAIALALRAARTAPGPHFILVKVTPAEAAVPRIPHTPRAIRDRFRRHCSGKFAAPC
jgi:phosphonopyruvate decarboxylase